MKSTINEASAETEASLAGESLLSEEEGFYQAENATVVDVEKTASLTAFSVQSFILNGDVSPVARNQRLINRLIISAGILANSFSVVLFNWNNRKGGVMNTLLVAAFCQRR